MTTTLDTSPPAPAAAALCWEELEPRYRALLARPVASVPELEALLLERSELEAEASELETELYIATTRRTDDEAARTAYLAFVTDVEPSRSELAFALERRIVLDPLAERLDRSRYGVLLRDLRAGVELFRPEILPLEAELAALDQAYNERLGAMTASFEGSEQTMAQLTRRLEDPERLTRERAWRAMHARWSEDRPALDEIFDAMIALRHRMALATDMADFRDLQHRRLRRFDYAPGDCLRFHEGVEAAVVPLLRRLDGRRAALLDLPALRPWDLAVDVHGRPPLRPFERIDELLAGSSRMFHRLRPSLGHMFDALRASDGLDLESRPGKAPGGYQLQRQRSRRPFVFMNATGVHRDLVALVHEAGHAFHAMSCAHEPLVDYRRYPMEFSEVASMSMELLTLDLLDEFYPAVEAERARLHHLEDLARRLAWTAQIDAFQHWLYTHPHHTRAERAAQWRQLDARFGPAVQWDGLEDALDSRWHRQIHLFSAPFYYIEYGIAQLGALELWARARERSEAALDDYLHALALGGSRPLPDLYAAAGLHLDFGVEAIHARLAPVVAEIDAE